MSAYSHETIAAPTGRIKKLRNRYKAIDVLVDVFDWYPSHYSPVERSLLRKLDWSLLVFASLSFFCKYLDQTNITNAYVSGMKEDVEGMGGNALNYMVTSWTAAYVLGQVPLTLVQSRPALAAYFLPTLEIVWAILTFAQSRGTKAWHFYLLRALIGFWEAPSFGATHFLLGSWYKNEELFKRAGTWFTCNALGSMISGYLQAATYKHLNGVAGLKGWQWLFVVDGIITLPIAFIGFVFFPGLPSSKKPWFMTAEEHALASTRLGPSQRTKAEKISIKTFIRTVKKPIWIIAVAIYAFLIQAHYWTGYMSLWLKSEPSKYSVEMINVLPTPINIIQAFSSWFGTSLAGVVPVLFMFSIPQVAMTFSLIVLIVWSVPAWLKFLAFYVAGTSGATSPILYSWLNTVMRDDPEARAITIGSMMAFGYSGNIWIPLLTFPTVESPTFPKGYPASLGFLIAMWITFAGAVIFMKRRSSNARDIESLPSPSLTTSSIDGEHEKTLELEEEFPPRRDVDVPTVKILPVDDSSDIRSFK